MGRDTLPPHIPPLSNSDPQSTSPGVVTASPTAGALTCSTPSTWVEILEIPQAVAGDDEPVEILLIDCQISPGTGERFSRSVEILNSIQSVQDHAQVEIVFNGETEAVTVHTVAIHRSGEAKEYATDTAFAIVPFEAHLERQAYDRRLKASLLLADLRPGDILEIAHTVTTIDPT